MTQAGVATAITLPTGITLYGASQPCRAVLFGANTQFPVIVVVNGATHDFTIDTYGVARALALSPPIYAPVPSAGAGTGLTGVYKVAVSFKIKDANGMTIFESDQSPISAATASLTNKSIRLDNIPVSGNGLVNARGLYRTTSGGSILYPWFDIDNNSDLFEDRDVADASLSILPAPINGAPPDFTCITRWKDRLWGIPRMDVDKFRWSEERIYYSWPTVNEGTLPPAQSDIYGGVGFIPRRDQLGILRRDVFYVVLGDSNDSFHRNKIADIGLVAPDSVVVNRDVGYFLGFSQGRYLVASWTDDGVRPISELQVDAWFNTTTYFNQTTFSKARGRYNPDTDCYELLLSNVGSSNLDRWVAYSIRNGVWYGPHKTDSFTPTVTGTDSDAQGTFTSLAGGRLAVFGGSNGFLYRRDITTTNDDGTAVAFNVDLPYLDADDNEQFKAWLDPTILARAEAGGTLLITPIVGEYGDAATPTYTHDLTKQRERLPRLGVGRYAQLNLQHSHTGEDVRLFQVLVPYFYLGRR